MGFALMLGPAHLDAAPVPATALQAERGAERGHTGPCEGWAWSCQVFLTAIQVSEKQGCLPLRCPVTCLLHRVQESSWLARGGACGLGLQRGTNYPQMSCPSFSIPFKSSLRGTSLWSTAFTLSSAGVPGKRGVKRAEESVSRVTVCKPCTG